MKSLVAAIVALVLAGAAPTHAYLVEVTISAAAAQIRDETTLKQALQSAVDEVLKDTIAFAPTLVRLMSAVMVGDRLYMRLLIADRDGEKTVRDLTGDGDESHGADLRI